MARVKVWNDNVHAHREEFKGQMVEIPAKSFIEMDYEDAVDFRGAFTPPKIKADGTHCPTGYKMIRVEQPTEPLFRETPLVNHATGQIAATQEELNKLLATVAHLRVVDKDAEAAVPKSSGEDARIKALEAQVEELKALVTGNVSKKKPGPKPGFKKEAVG
jgi:hypothetical protein